MKINIFKASSIWLSIGLFIILIIYPQSSDALSCAPFNKVDFLNKGNVILYGTVTKISDTTGKFDPVYKFGSPNSDDHNLNEITFDVHYAWTGPVREPISDKKFIAYDPVPKNINTNLNDIWGFGRTFQEGKSYIVYSNKSQKDGHEEVNIGGCSRSFEIRNPDDFNKIKKSIINETQNEGYSVSQNDETTIDLLKKQIAQLLALVASLQQQLAQAIDGGTTPTQQPVIQCEDFAYNLYLGKRDNVTNGEVTKLQRFLTNTGDYNGLVGGYFGPATERAVQSWQRKNGVVSSGTPDSTGYGVVGPSTRGKMRCGESPGGFIPEFVTMDMYCAWVKRDGYQSVKKRYPNVNLEECERPFSDRVYSDDDKVINLSNKFEVTLPSKWRYEKGQGIDSFVGKFVNYSSNNKISFDYGRYGGTCRKMDGYLFTKEKIDGLETCINRKILSTNNNPVKDISVYITINNGCDSTGLCNSFNKIGLSLHAKNIPNKLEAEVMSIIRSIKIKKQIDNQPPTIYSFTGPTTLKVGEGGLWNLTGASGACVNVIWGDGDAGNSVCDGLNDKFEHTYTRVGTYIIIVKVEGSIRARAKVTVIGYKDNDHSQVEDILHKTLGTQIGYKNEKVATKAMEFIRVIS